MSGPRVVIFGGSGFIGTRLTDRLLRAGMEVRIADLATSRKFPELSVACDVRDFEATRTACEAMDIVYNLAAEHADDVRPLEKYFDVNVEGARVVCRAAEAAGIRRMVFTSSVAVYGLPDEELDETAAPNPFNEYGRTKLLAEAVYQEWVRKATDRGLVIVRPTVVFGEGNRANFYNLARQVASGYFLMVGRGENRKSIAYVENVAAFLEFILRFEQGEHLFNYVDKPDMSMNELVPLILGRLGRGHRANVRLPYWLGMGMGKVCDGLARLTGRKLPISAVRIMKFCASTQFSSARALATGFVPPVDLISAVERTIDAEFVCGEGNAPVSIA